MSADDDGDCVEHVWVLDEAYFTLKGAEQVYRCTRCAAVRYQPGQAALRDTRPPLGGAGDTR